MIQKDTAIVFWFYQLLVEKLCVVWVTTFKKKIPKYWANRNSKDRRLRREITKVHKCKDQVLAFICSLSFIRLKEVTSTAFKKKKKLLCISRAQLQYLHGALLSKLVQFRRRSGDQCLKVIPWKIQQVIFM